MYFSSSTHSICQRCSWTLTYLCMLNLLIYARLYVFILATYAINFKAIDIYFI
jgi:hypothetical protein